MLHPPGSGRGIKLCPNNRFARRGQRLRNRRLELPINTREILRVPIVVIVESIRVAQPVIRQLGIESRARREDEGRHQYAEIDGRREAARGEYAALTSFLLSLGVVLYGGQHVCLR